MGLAGPIKLEINCFNKGTQKGISLLFYLISRFSHWMFQLISPLIQQWEVKNLQFDNDPCPFMILPFKIEQIKKLAFL